MPRIEKVSKNSYAKLPDTVERNIIETINTMLAKGTYSPTSTPTSPTTPLDADFIEYMHILEEGDLLDRLEIPTERFLPMDFRKITVTINGLVQEYGIHYTLVPDPSNPDALLYIDFDEGILEIPDVLKVEMIL